MQPFIELDGETDFEVGTSDFVEEEPNSDRPPALPHGGESGLRFMPDLQLEYSLGNPWTSKG